jgi:hypothetical protein
MSCFSDSVGVAADDWAQATLPSHMNDRQRVKAFAFMVVPQVLARFSQSFTVFIVRRS